MHLSNKRIKSIPYPSESGAYDTIKGVDFSERLPHPNGILIPEQIMAQIVEKYGVLILRQAIEQILTPEQKEIFAMDTRLQSQYPEKIRASNFNEAFLFAMAKNREESYYFLNEGKLRETLRVIKSNFMPDHPYALPTYAIKANPNKRVIEIINEEKFGGFDAASVGEIKQLKMQNPNADIAFNHPIKSNSDIKTALNLGVRKFIVQDAWEARKIIHASRQQNIQLEEITVRLETNNESAEINLSEKFGAPYSEAKNILIELKIRIPTGIAIHTGSQNKDIESYRSGIRLMTDLAREVGGVKSINTGGGVPVDDEDARKLEDYIKEISASVAENLNGVFSPDEKNPRIYCEIGRAIAAPAYTLTIPIIGTRIKHGVNELYIEDGIFDSFSDNAIHDWQYTIDAYNLNGEKLKGPKVKYILNGRSCDSGDKMTAFLQNGVSTNHILVIKNAGAYMDSQGGYFNGQSPHKQFSYNLTK